MGRRDKGRFEETEASPLVVVEEDARWFAFKWSQKHHYQYLSLPGHCQNISLPVEMCRGIIFTAGCGGHKGQHCHGLLLCSLHRVWP